MYAKDAMLGILDMMLNMSVCCRMYVIWCDLYIYESIQKINKAWMIISMCYIDALRCEIQLYSEYRLI
jgi:hypothetical protein